ncbi:MAG: bacillithiol biosynthesis cysteine-adding enzyme BshC [Terracidiphilus sp.]
MTAVPGFHPLFLDYCSGSANARQFYLPAPPAPGGQARPPAPGHWPEMVKLLMEQNPSPSPSAAAAIDALREGAGVVVTGQQVGLLGGPLFTPFKAATALARARQATTAGDPHAALFWLATEDHDFAEINHVVFPARRELLQLDYGTEPGAPLPVGGIVLEEAIAPIIDQAWELLGDSEAMDALAEAYRPGRTFAQAFADFYRKAFAAQGLLVLDASGRTAHRIGAPVLRAAIEGADELHHALLQRNLTLQAAGYHIQVTVGPQSSLLFLLDSNTGARLALKRKPASPQEPDGVWQAGRQSYSTADLTGILEAEPERISPAALLRPVFQDFLLSTSCTVGGPAEIAYFAQSAVLFKRILGRVTPVLPRFSATLVEPEIGDLLHRHHLTLEQVFAETQDSLAQLLAARSLPSGGRDALAAASGAMEAELASLLGWMQSLDAGLGRAAETSARKMRYQMNRLRRLAANFQLQRDAALGRQAARLSRSLYPNGVLQERLHGAAYYFARYGFALAERITAKAEKSSPGHAAMWL